MTRQEEIELLQDQIRHNRIDEVELDRACEEWKLNLWDDILFPIGYNTCDRCGDYGDSELDFCWLDGFDWDEENAGDRAMLRAIAEEKVDYCAVCWDCINELREKGKKLMEKKIVVNGESVATPVKVKVLTK